MSESTRPPEWYRAWFGEEYLALYPHRDEEEAREGVELVLDMLGPPTGPILDLACGAGRHLVEFERCGYAAIGLDLSRELLRSARAARDDLVLVRGDMRHLPFADEGFELVTNFFTSFGYFAEPEEDRHVLNEIRRVLRRGGRFALDFLNAERVKHDLVGEDERRMRDRRVLQRRSLDEGGRVVVKEIDIVDPDTSRIVRTFHERVRLYSREELERLLDAAGLRTEYRFGDYTGAALSPDSPRCILLGSTT